VLEYEGPATRFALHQLLVPCLGTSQGAPSAWHAGVGCTSDRPACAAVRALLLSPSGKEACSLKPTRMHTHMRTLAYRHAHTHTHTHMHARCRDFSLPLANPMSEQEIQELRLTAYRVRHTERCFSREYALIRSEEWASALASVPEHSPSPAHVHSSSNSQLVSHRTPFARRDRGCATCHGRHPVPPSSSPTGFLGAAHPAPPHGPN